MKRVISFLFIGALFLSVFACGGVKENKEAESTQETTESTEVKVEEESVPSEELQIEGDTLDITEVEEVVTE